MNVPSKDKFLFFAKGAGADGNNEAVLYPVSSFRGFDVASATTIDLFFTPQRITSVVSGADNDTIRIQIGTDAGTLVTVLEALANEIAFGSDTVIKVDSDNSVFFNSNVVGCTAITLAT
tara:strand:+ start:152 stop:508 length:357 start_codon:yes stop_codon:yes gene_type:complete